MKQIDFGTVGPDQIVVDDRQFIVTATGPKAQTLWPIVKSCMHFGGHDKLSRYGFPIHGCTDGHRFRNSFVSLMFDPDRKVSDSDSELSKGLLTKLYSGGYVDNQTKGSSG
jgi:hypothetical protein